MSISPSPYPPYMIEDTPVITTFMSYTNQIEFHCRKNMTIQLHLGIFAVLWGMMCMYTVTRLTCVYIFMCHCSHMKFQFCFPKFFGFAFAFFPFWKRNIWGWIPKQTFSLSSVKISRWLKNLKNRETRFTKWSRKISRNREKTRWENSFLLLKLCKWKTVTNLMYKICLYTEQQIKGRKKENWGKITFLISLLQ